MNLLELHAGFGLLPHHSVTQSCWLQNAFLQIFWTEIIMSDGCCFSYFTTGLKCTRMFRLYFLLTVVSLSSFILHFFKFKFSIFDFRFSIFDFRLWILVFRFSFNLIFYLYFYFVFLFFIFLFYSPDHLGSRIYWCFFLQITILHLRFVGACYNCHRSILYSSCC